MIVTQDWTMVLWRREAGGETSKATGGTKLEDSIQYIYMIIYKANMYGDYKYMNNTDIMMKSGGVSAVSREKGWLAGPGSADDSGAQILAVQSQYTGKGW